MKNGTSLALACFSLLLLGGCAGGDSSTSQETAASEDAAVDATAAPRRILYESVIDGQSEIVLVHEDGTGRTRLTDDPAYDGMPSWTPDGDILFVSDRAGGEGDLWLMRDDGSRLRKLTADSAGYSFPSFSPDGWWIGFDAARGGETAQVWVMKTTGADLRPVSPSDVDEGYVSWTPGSDGLVYDSFRDGEPEIYRGDLATGAVTRLTHLESHIGDPRLSPDGTLLAFESGRDGNSEIYVANADGSEPRRLTDDPADDRAPAISHDNRRVVFSSDRDGEREAFELWVMDIDGANLRQLTDTGTANLYATFEPPTPSPDRPEVTDEFERFLVTAATEVGDALGTIETVSPSALPITWSLVPPVPGGDRRHYLREGQLDATEIVTIDPQTAEVSLIASPESFPAHYYAEVRATSDAGFMEAVVIVIALESTPLAENATDIFTQRVETPGVTFWATAGVDPAKVEYAAKVADTLLMKDREGSGAITEAVARRNAIMTLFQTFEERNTAIGFYMHRRALGLRTQDLEDEEIIPDYLRLGGPEGLRRDASVEEITHLIHRGGIMEAYPEVQERLERATAAAIERGFYRPQPGLPEDSYADEYLAYGLDMFYGAHRRDSFEGVPLTPENLETLDPELHDILSFLFPSRAEFFRAMGWEDDI